MVAAILLLGAADRRIMRDTPDIAHNRKVGSTTAESLPH
jgi:hypothetical protein